MTGQKKIYIFFLTSILLLCHCLLSSAQDSAQFPTPQPPADSANIIHLLNADILMGIQPGKSDTDQLQKLQGNVLLRQGQTFFSCDSALQNVTKNTIDAFGHIHINQADTIQTYADFLHYEGNTKIATLQKNVRMEDAEMVLTTNFLDYDMDTHIGSYLNGGKLVNKSTVLTSQRGYYYADTKDVYFKTNVQLTDPEYTLATDTLLYNTVSRIATFEAPTTINTGRSIIHTTCGYYSTIENYAHLCNRSMIIDSSQQLTADSMNYHKATGIGVAYGNVVWTDTAQHITVLANYAISDQTKKTVMATQKPLTILERKSDTLYIAADTLFSGILPRQSAADSNTSRPPTPPGSSPVSTLSDTSKLPSPAANAGAPGEPRSDKIVSDSVAQKVGEVPEENSSDKISEDSISQKVEEIPQETVPDKLVSDSVSKKVEEIPQEAASDKIASDSVSQKVEPANHVNDTTDLRYIIAYHNVRLFSDSLQGIADSLYYSDADSAFRFYKEPVLWTGVTQLTGDTITLLTKNQQADQLLLRQHGMIINEAGPGMYNQIKGNVITGYFKDDNAIDWMSVDGNAESLYYAQDDNNAFVGGNHSTSARIHLYFKDGELNKVVLLKDVDGEFTPPTKMTEEDKKLKGFQWEESRRPKDKASLMQ